ncbi:hypothetical protein [Rhodopirellula baltica]|uniref:Uncharacterized protein n=1 Tax=Rhodopirellula baltica SWK14 TaxID=993516 RepID=L7C912_RHOBT|nr:hypothetical protein [Rhodopirellula baltica]ELP30147.1 hypothetical protein RBSWK_05905 [Rhodopirellula baltica SWK14]
MQENRSIFGSLSALIGTGAAVALLSLFGIAAVPEPEPAKADKDATELPATVTKYPAVDGSVSYSSDMWDDPFRHAEFALKDKDITKPSDIRDTINSKLGPDGVIMHLVVSVPEGKTTNDIEERSRRRHSLELALANHGFSMPFADRMTFRRAELTYHFEKPELKSKSAENPTDSTGGTSTAQSKANKEIAVVRNLAVPFKLYGHTDKKHFILVTWVLESDLGKKPLDTIRQVLKDVAPILNQRKTSALCILGPYWSGTLRDIIAEAKSYSREKNPDDSQQEAKNDAGPKCKDDNQLVDMPDFYENWGQGLMLCNYTCTSSDESIGLKSGQNEIDIAGNKMQLVHTIGSDERLIRTIQHELEIRGVWPSSKRSGRMVLFAEQGSLEYVNDIRKRFSTSGGLNPIFIPYLKGISSRHEDRSSVQDYLDRSMSRLAMRRDTESEQSEPVKLIGILGSDWDDKNLILKKAREAFPVATFFTLELDARYSRPDAVKHGRNLIIASHYGLRVDGRPDIFGQVSSIPRFRDQYQTSGFVGGSILCKAFLDDRLNSKEFILQHGAIHQDLFDIVGRRKVGGDTPTSAAFLKPSVFEVGRGGPIQLQSNATLGHSYLPLRQPAAFPSIHQRPWMPVIVLVALMLIAVVFNTIAGFSSDAKLLQEGLTTGAGHTLQVIKSMFTGAAIVNRETYWPQLIAVVIGLAIFFVMVGSSFANESEPILISEGISIWPSIVGLYLVIAFSLASLRDLFTKQKKKEAEDTEAPYSYPTVRRKRMFDSGACKLAGVLVLGFYLTSYLESGFITPPARDWVVAWLGSIILFIATTSILLVACRCLIYALHARKVIRDFEDTVEEDSPQQLADHCHRTMLLSIESSRDLVTPAILSLIFLAARSRYWDAWGLDLSWYILIGVPIATCLIAAIIVRLTAISLRNKSLDFLRSERFLQLVGERRSRDYNAEVLEHAIEEIARLRLGPYGPITKDYILGAAAILVAVAISGPVGGLVEKLLIFLH